MANDGAEIRDTSLQAYGRHADGLAGQQLLVFRTLERLGAATAYELDAKIATLDTYQIRRRLSDLANKGKIVDTKQRRKPNKNASPCIVWAPAWKRQQLELPEEEA